MASYLNVIKFNDCGQSFYKDCGRGIQYVTREELQASVTRCMETEDVDDLEENVDFQIFEYRDEVADLLSHDENRDTYIWIVWDEGAFFVGSDAYYGRAVGAIMAWIDREVEFPEYLDSNGGLPGGQS